MGPTRDPEFRAAVRRSATEASGRRAVNEPRRAAGEPRRHLWAAPRDL
ncbi:hypothetical protein [Streptomyces murinus]